MAETEWAVLLRYVKIPTQLDVVLSES
jgi:hypothetical protein